VSIYIAGNKPALGMAGQCMFFRWNELMRLLPAVLGFRNYYLAYRLLLLSSFPATLELHASVLSPNPIILAQGI
jgi:hypothetical protein